MTASPRCAFGYKPTKYKMICLCLVIKVKLRFCKWKQVLFNCNLGHPDSPGLHQHYQVKLIGWYWHGNCFSLFNRPGQQYSKMSHFKIALISKLKNGPRVPHLPHAAGDLPHFGTEDRFAFLSLLTAHPGTTGSPTAWKINSISIAASTPLRNNVTILFKILTLPS